MARSEQRVPAFAGMTAVAGATRANGTVQEKPPGVPFVARDPPRNLEAVSEHMQDTGQPRGES